jgi:PPOX class probable F420-dependent enzyme
VPALTRADALQAFVGQPVAVLGTADQAGTPHLVPVTFALVGNCVVFAVDFKPKASAGLRRLDNIQVRPAVSFLVDEYHEDWERLWWVRVDGSAKIVRGVSDDNRYEEALDALADKYRQYRAIRPSGVVVIARMTAVRGWAFTASHAGRRPPSNAAGP